MLLKIGLEKSKKIVKQAKVVFSFHLEKLILHLNWTKL
jgi:hypothetical protein